MSINNYIPNLLFGAHWPLLLLLPFFSRLCCDDPFIAFQALSLFIVADSVKVTDQVLLAIADFRASETV